MAIPVGFRMRWKGKRLQKAQIVEVLDNITSEHCHAMGRRWKESYQEGVTSICIKRKKEGFFSGAGVCVYKRFVTKDDFCYGCRSEQITIQLNWLFDKIWARPELVAYWVKQKEKKHGKKRRKRG